MCGALERGDRVCHVDGVAVSADGLHQALLGDDIPGSSLTLTVSHTASLPCTTRPPPLALALSRFLPLSHSLSFHVYLCMCLCVCVPSVC